MDLPRIPFFVTFTNGTIVHWNLQFISHFIICFLATNRMLQVTLSSGMSLGMPASCGKWLQVTENNYMSICTNCLLKMQLKLTGTSSSSAHSIHKIFEMKATRSQSTLVSKLVTDNPLNKTYCKLNNRFEIEWIKDDVPLSIFVSPLSHPLSHSVYASFEPIRSLSIYPTI